MQALRFSEELIRTIRKTLIREIQRQQASNTTWTTHWFKSFRSTKNGTLSDEQVARLASLTQHWALSPEDSESLARNARTWISDPTEFWGSTSHSMGLIQRCLSDVESLEDRKKLNPIRRRIILIIVSERIQKETMRLQAEGSAKRRQRQCIMKGNFTKYISRAVKNVIEREHHPKGLSDDEMKETSRKVIRMARYGGKWLLLEDTEALLAIPSRNSLSFEQAKLSEIELEAINMFQRSLHLNGNREELKRALSAIRNKYTNWHGIVSPDADDSIQPPQSVQRREQRLPIKHGRSGARRRKQQLQPSSTSSLQSARISATRNDSNGVSDGEARLLWDMERLDQSGTELPDVQPPSPKRIRLAQLNSDQSIDVNARSSADRRTPSYSEDLVHSLDDQFQNRSSVRTSRPRCTFHSSIEAPVILPGSTDASDLGTVEGASGQRSVVIPQWNYPSEQSHGQSERQLIRNVPTNGEVTLPGPGTDGSAEKSLPADPRNGIQTANLSQLSNQATQATDPQSTSAREGAHHNDSRDGPLPLLSDTALYRNSGDSGDDGVQRLTNNTHENLEQNTDTITNFSQSKISDINFNGDLDLQSSTGNLHMQSPFGHGGSEVALSDLNQSQLDTVREIVSVRNEYGAVDSTQRAGNVIVDSPDALQLHQSITITQDSSVPFQAESGGMATVHPCDLLDWEKDFAVPWLAWEGDFNMPWLDWEKDFDWQWQYATGDVSI